MSIYDLNCAELIHDFVELNLNDFCYQNIDFDCSEFEYALMHFSAFKAWAQSLGYDITC